MNNGLISWRNSSPGEAALGFLVLDLLLSLMFGCLCIAGVNALRVRCLFLLILGGRVFWRWRGRSLSCRDVWYYQAAFLVFYLVTILSLIHI